MKFYEQDKDTAVLKMYTEIGWWETNARNMSETIEQLSAKYKNILIRVHCYGGSVFDGNVIYNAIKTSKAYIIIRIEGVAASMMTIVMCGADEVHIVDNGFVMVHCPTTYVAGNAKELASASKLLTMMEKNFVKKYAAKTGKTEAEIRGYFDGSDHWLDADEALAIGFVDKIVPPVVEDIAQLAKPEPGTDPALVYDRYTALLTADKEFPNQTTTASMKQLLITMFSLTGVSDASSDQDVANAVKAKLDSIENQLQAQAKAGIDSLIAQAETSRGKTFDEKEKEVLSSIGMKAGLHALQMSLGITAAAAAPTEKPGTPTPFSASTTPILMNMLNGQPGSGGQPAMTWDEYQEKDPKALARMESENWAMFSQLYEAKYGSKPDK